MGDHLRKPICVDFSLGNGQPAPQLDDTSPGDKICRLRSPEEIDRHARGDGLQGGISQLAEQGCVDRKVRHLEHGWS